MSEFHVCNATFDISYILIYNFINFLFTFEGNAKINEFLK